MQPNPSPYPQVLPVGETAFTVEFGDSVDAALNTRVHALDAILQANPIPGVTERVPTYRSLLVMYDPCRVEPGMLKAQLQSLAKQAEPDAGSGTGAWIDIPVQYGGAWGPDLADVAAHTHLSPEAVIRLHTGATYQVAMLGFAPGFTYLLGLPEALHTPRLATPRVHIAPGSVGIAGSQTGLYALDTPGGWRIIGRTPLKLFDPESEPPFMLNAGDRVRFKAVG